MRERRPVEVEADGALWAAARRINPGEARVLVDEALDEPGAREPIDPQVLARRPEAAAVLRRVQALDASARRAGLAVGVQPAKLRPQSLERGARLRLRLAGKVVQGREILERLLQLAHGRFGLALA